ncbi:unnamed protein product [Malus baccata var. baccata]
MERGFNDIILECDSLQIVEALLRNSSDMSNEGHTIEDSKDALLRITGASVSHTRRQGNGVAHLLARSALPMDSSSCSWFEEPLDLSLDCFPLIVISYAGGFARKVPHVTSPNTVEILAVREGLELAAQKNWQLVILEYDALLVVQAIGSVQSGSSAIDLLIDDIKTRMRGFDKFEVCHVHQSRRVECSRWPFCLILQVASLRSLQIYFWLLSLMIVCIINILNKTVIVSVDIEISVNKC